MRAPFATRRISAFDLAAAALLLRSFWLRAQWDASASRLGQTNRDRLLARACAFVAVFHAVHLFSDELAGCSRGAFALAQRAFRLFDRLFDRHDGNRCNTRTNPGLELQRGLPRECCRSPQMRRSCVSEHYPAATSRASGRGGAPSWAKSSPRLVTPCER